MIQFRNIAIGACLGVFLFAVGLLSSACNSTPFVGPANEPEACPVRCGSYCYPHEFECRKGRAVFVGNWP